MLKDEVRDAGLIAAAQRVSTMRMASYGCARTYARVVGGSARSAVYFKLLYGGIRYRQKANQLAKSVINVAAK